MNQLHYEFLYEAHFDLTPPHKIESPAGVLLINMVTGGWMKGPKFTVTEILSAAGDWIQLRSDGVRELDVRMSVKLDDGHLMYINYGGIIDYSPDVFARIMQGEAVDPAEYYFRVIPRFQTGSEKYAWLNNAICVANGKAGPGMQWVEYTAFQIL